MDLSINPSVFLSLARFTWGIIIYTGCIFILYTYVVSPYIEFYKLRTAAFFTFFMPSAYFDISLIFH